MKAAVDVVAVERAMTGEPLPLNIHEQIEVIRRMAAAGHNDAQITRTLRVGEKFVLRRRQENGIESRWEQ